jgi:hypothetical protein
LVTLMEFSSNLNLGQKLFVTMVTDY